MPRDRSRTSDGTGENERRLEPLLTRAVEADDLSALEDVVETARRNGQLSDAFLKIGLMRGAEKNKVNATAYLLRTGANPSATGKGNRTGPLRRAVERNHVAIVKLLLENKINPVDMNEADKKGRTALMTAAWKNHWHVLQLMINAGADINAKDLRKRNVMHNLAADKQRDWGMEVVELLLSHDVAIDGENGCDEHLRSPLHWCCVTGKRTLAEALLTRRRGGRANVNAIEKRQKTPLHMAASHDWDDIVELLLMHGAKVDLISDGGWTALHNACEKGSTTIVRILLAAGADINARLLNGRTPLHVAADAGHVDVVKTLLDDPNVKIYARDGFGFTSFLLAAQKKHRDCVNLLAPTNHADSMSHDALGACQGFFATVTDFGNYRQGNEVTKISIWELLYAKSLDNPKKNAFELLPTERKATQFRWIHLPANNLAWIEALMTKCFVEEGHHDVDGFKAIERSFSHQHRGSKVHSHFMRPMCQPTPRATPFKDTIPEDILENGIVSSPPNRSTTGFSLENSTTGFSTTSDSIPEKHASPPDGKEPKSKKAKKANTRPSMGKKSSSAKENGTPKSPQPGQLKKSISSADGTILGRTKSSSDFPVDFNPRSNIVLFSPFLHFETYSARTQMHEAIKRARQRSKPANRASEPVVKGLSCDEMLIRAHLYSSSLSLHVRRTLDQFFYHNIDTDVRDQDQVVYRYQTIDAELNPTIDPKIFMVDQLWMWVLGKDLIVTSFPQRWQQPRNDPLNMLDGIIEDVNSRTRDPVRSVYDLALVITARCTGMFDRHRVGDGDYQFLDMFESSIGNATDRETILFQEFNVASSQASEWLKSHRKPSRFGMMQESSGKDAKGRPKPDAKFSYNDERHVSPLFVDQLLDIGQETDLLAESKDIRDEINMINKVLEDQRHVLKDLEVSICDIYRDEHRSQQDVKRCIRDQIKTIDVHIKDLDRMDKQAERIYDSITNLLDLKQKHANAFEARFARDQAAGTARQSQTIMVFTIVTIVFLPLSFMTSFFAINIDFSERELTSNFALPMGYVSKYTFGIGFAISIPLIFLALSLDKITDGWRVMTRAWPRRRRKPTADEIHIEETLAAYRKSMEVASVTSAPSNWRPRKRTGHWDGTLLPVTSRTTAHSGWSRR